MSESHSMAVLLGPTGPVEVDSTRGITFRSDHCCL